MEGKMNFFLIGIIAFLSAAVAFIVIYLVMTGTILKPSSAKAAAKEQTKEVKIDYKKAQSHEVKDMIINLKPDKNNQKAMIKVSVSIIVADLKFSEEFTKREGEIEDIIRSVFNGKTASDIEGIKIDKVKEELLHDFKAMYHEPKESDKILKVLIPSAFVQLQ